MLCSDLLFLISDEKCPDIVLVLFFTDPLKKKLLKTLLPPKFPQGPQNDISFMFSKNLPKIVNNCSLIKQSY